MVQLKGTNSKRSADNVIKGFVYQFCMSLDAWMKLKENELLILEGAEDLDIHKGDSVETIQVKHVKAKVSLNSKDIQDAISNFWKYRTENSDRQIRFRFISTSLPAQEKGSPFGNDIKGIELWAKPAKTSEEIKSLVTFLKGIVGLTDDLKNFIDSASDEELQDALFGPVTWDLGEKPLEVLEANVKRALVCNGLRYSVPVPATESIKTFPALMLKIIEEIIASDSLGLTLADFHLAYESQIISFSEQVRALQASDQNGTASILKEYIEAGENKDLLALATLQNTFTEPPPIPSHSVPRRILMDQIEKTTLEKSVAFVIGSSGVGKTTLASHYVEHTRAQEKWLDLRGLKSTHIKQILKSLNTLIHLGADRECILVLDDLDLKSGYRDYEHELKLLVFNAVHNKQKVIITCQIEPPQRLLHDTWITEECVIKVGHFDLNEIEEIAVVNGCPDTQPASTWANIIYVGTSGHPQLVRARIQNLKAKNWVFDEADFIEPEAIKNEKKTIREQLISEIPERARDLAYRLSLTLGTFNKSMINVLAGLDPKINMGGEAFDMLVGPWIEQTAGDRYRISPLLSGQGKEIFDEDKQRKIHAAICMGYLKQGTPLNQNEVGKLFMHGMLSKDGGVLTAIIKGTLDNLFETSKHEIMKYVAEELFWFYLMGKEKGQRIFPENLHVNYMLRIIQFKFFCLSNVGNDASILAERLLDDMKAAMEVAEEKGAAELWNEHSEFMTYSTLMITTEKRLSSRLIIPILPRFAELAEKYKEILPRNDPPPNLMWMRRTGKDYFDPVSIFLEAHTMRANGTPDLEEFFDCIDTLDEKSKAFMIKTLKENPDVVRSLCDNAWVKELFQKEKKDIFPLIKIYEKGILYAEQWNIPRLKLHCILTMSVLYDEYSHDMDKAFGILEIYEDFLKDFQEFLINQKAKIFFNNKWYKDAVSLLEETLTLNKLGDIDKVFTLKHTAISFARIGDWDKARNYMKQCLDLILYLRKESGYSFDFVDTGLIADIAFADWKLKRWADALKGFSGALIELENLKKTEDKKLLFVALYARTGHMISWMAQDADGNQTLEEPPPCCASNPEGSDFFQDFQIRPSIYLWSLLSSTEKSKGVDVGATNMFLEKGQNTEFINAKILSNFQELNVAFVKHDFSNIIPLSANFLRMKKTLEEMGLEDKELIDVTLDTLCELDKVDQNLLEQIVFHVIFAACVTLFMSEKTPNRFIEQWEQQIRDLKLENSNTLDEFINFIKQCKFQMKPFTDCKKGIVDQCKFVIENMPLLLTPSEVDPITLFRLHFHMTNVLHGQTFRNFMEAALLEAIKKGWKEVVDHKTFALKNPRLNVPKIKQLCEATKKGKLSDVALILLEASDCININLPESSKDYLREIAA
jgi:hypothetical protein